MTHIMAIIAELPGVTHMIVPPKFYRKPDPIEILMQSEYMVSAYGKSNTDAQPNRDVYQERHPRSLSTNRATQRPDNARYAWGMIRHPYLLGGCSFVYFLRIGFGNSTRVR